MAEIGIDISTHRSKSVDEFADHQLDHVITVCDHAREACPFVGGGRKRLHKSFQDPSAFRGNTEEHLELFRRVRDRIADWIGETFVAGEKSVEHGATVHREEAAG
jgi:arsenate reductase